MNIFEEIILVDEYFGRHLKKIILAGGHFGRDVDAACNAIDQQDQ